MWTVIKEGPDIMELSVTNIFLFEHQRKTVTCSGQFSKTYGVTNCGSGWRKDVVNLCLEYGTGSEA